MFAHQTKLLCQLPIQLQLKTEKKFVQFKSFEKQRHEKALLFKIGQKLEDSDRRNHSKLYNAQSCQKSWGLQSIKVKAMAQI